MNPFKQMWRYALDKLMGGSLSDVRILKDLETVKNIGNARLSDLLKSKYKGLEDIKRVKQWLDYTPKDIIGAKKQLATLTDFVKNDSLSTVEGLNAVRAKFIQHTKNMGLDMSRFETGKKRKRVNWDKAFNEYMDLYSDVVSGGMNGGIGSSTYKRFLNWTNKDGLREFKNSAEIANEMWKWKSLGEPDNSATYRRKYKGIENFG